MTMERAPLRQEVGRLLKIAAPLIVSNLFFTIQILLDRVMLSWYDTDAMAAAGAAAMVCYPLIGFLQNTVGFATTFVAQYVGAGRPQRVGPIVNQALWLGVFSGGAVALLAGLAPDLMRLTGHDARLQELEAVYGYWMAVATLPLVVTAAATAFFAGRGETLNVVFINAAGTIVNGVANYALIFGNWGFPPMGINGAGLGVALGSAASASMSLALYWQPRYRAAYQTRSGWAFDIRLARQLLYFGVPNGLGWAMDMIVWTLFTVFIGWLGKAPLAATMIAFNINASFLIPMLGMAQAVSVLVGQRLGANRPDLAERITWIGYALAVSVMTGLGILVACYPAGLLAVFQAQAETQTWAETARLLPTLLVFVAVYTFFDSSQIVLSFALRGAGDTLFVTAFMLAAGLALVVVPAAYVCAQGWSLYWVWGIATGYLAVLAAGFFLRFRYGPWRTMRVIESEAALREEFTSASEAPELAAASAE
jgi:MATE family multidrug resistance protein